MNSQEILNQINVSSNKRVENAKDKIKQINYNTQQREKFEEKLYSFIPEIVTALAKMHLEIIAISSTKTGIRCDWEDKDYLSVSITATSPNKKFKWLSFQGYTAKGSGINEKALMNKKGKIEEKLSNQTGIDNFQINPYSLETKDEKENRVLISLWIR